MPNVINIRNIDDLNNIKDNVDGLYDGIYDDGIYHFSGPNFNFEHAQLEDAELIGSDFVGTKMAGVDFRGAELDGADFSRADLTGANFTRLVSSNGGQIVFKDAILRGAIFDGAELDSADFRGANLTDAKFRDRADVRGIDVRGATLINTDFRGSNFLNEGDSIEFNPGDFDQAYIDRDDDHEYYDDEYYYGSVPQQEALSPEFINQYVVREDIKKNCNDELESIIDTNPFEPNKTFKLSDGYCYSINDLRAFKQNNVIKSPFTRALWKTDDKRLIQGSGTMVNDSGMGKRSKKSKNKGKSKKSKTKKFKTKSKKTKTKGKKNKSRRQKR